MRNEYVSLNHVQTHLLTWGDPFNCGGQDVIICITGNPGIIDFYIDFGCQLNKNTGLPVCVIGQAGHEEVPDEKSNILKGQEHLFNLEGQVAHKLELINNFIDKESRLHLIGHSIGAWLILELLKDNENLNMRLSSVNLLFPTLQKMAETRNGKFVNNILRRFNYFFMLLFHLTSLLPSFIISFLVESFYLKVQSLPLKYSKPIFQFLKPTVGEKILFLAYNEMDTVKSLNIKVLERIKKYTYVIYSTKDNWAPMRYIDDLQMFQPQIRLEKVDFDHAFVLKSSDRVAEMVSNFIKAMTWRSLNYIMVL